MTQLPEWANWLARDEDGELNAHADKPRKLSYFWTMDLGGRIEKIKETDDTFSHIEWTDEEPTKIYGWIPVTMAHTNNNKDMVNQPNHYIGECGLEVEDVLRNFIPRYTDPYVGHRIASAIEYLLRSPLKNGQQDIEKARKNLDQALGYMEEKEE